MFSVPFLPDFPGLRRRILSLTRVPELPVPAETEQALGRIVDPDSFELARLATGDTRALWRSCFRAVRPLLIRTIGVSVFAAVAASGATLLGMELLKTGRTAGALALLTFGLFLLSVLSQLGAFGSDRLRLYVGLTVETHLVSLISAKLLQISPRRRAAHTSGNLMVLVTSDAKNVGAFFDNLARNLVPSIAAISVMSPVVIHLTGWAGAIGIFVMGLVLPISALLGKINTTYQSRSQQELENLASLSGEWVKNIRLIRYLSWGERIEKELAEVLHRFSGVASMQHLMACLLFGISVSWWMLSVAGVAWSAQGLGLRLDVVGFFGSIWLITYLAGYVTHIPNTIRLYSSARPSAVRIAKLLGEETVAGAFRTDLPDMDLAGRKPVAIHFDRVEFRFGSDGEPVLREFTARIDLRKKTAILGEIGAGKTTFLKLLCGDMPPTGGQIRVELDDGASIDLWHEPVHRLFREQLGYVPQEPYVSNDSLGANIALEDSWDETAVSRSVAWAELEADVAELERGLAQEIGENGVNLSGGQRQRVNLARAFCSRRPFLVLDDTLSAVDVRTERLLMERLLAETRGFVLVTHRVGEIAQLDRILIFRGGRIVEDGDPRALMGDSASVLNRILQAYREAETHE